MNQVRRGTGRDTTRPCNTTPHTQTHNTNIQTHTQTDQIRCTQQICRYCRLGRGGVNSDGNYAHARTLFTYLHLLLLCICTVGSRIPTSASKWPRIAIYGLFLTTVNIHLPTTQNQLGPLCYKGRQSASLIRY
jgi:hypothetical protein